MMPLALADVGAENLILKVGGSPEVKKHLEDLGFVAGGTATVVASMSGNIIVQCEGSPCGHQRGNGPARSWYEQVHKKHIEGEKNNENVT